MSEIPDKIAVFDLETTGVDVYENRIITGFLGLMDRYGNLTEKKSWVINPGVPIPAEAIAIHGITDDYVGAHGVEAKDGIFSILQAIDIHDRKGIPIAGFNLQYDLSLLYYEAKRYGFRPVEPRIVLDGYVLDKHIDPYRKGKRTLTAQADTYGIKIVNAHDAEGDCIVAGQLIYRLLQDDRLQYASLESLMKLQAEWKAEQSASLQEFFRRTDPDAVVDGRWPIMYEEDK